MAVSGKRIKRWKFLNVLVRQYVRPRFHLTAERCVPAEPCLIVANHVTNWDPLFVGISFPETPIRFVASEHIFRHGAVSRLLDWLVAPIPRRKAASGADTVMSVLRALKAGETVCLFAEGDASWDGRTHPVFPATGKLARMAGVPLLTYRLTGGYLSLPRWSSALRRGAVQGAKVGFYLPEELKRMKPAAVTELINRDLFEDAFARQEREHVRFRAQKRAEGIERGFFICPQCGALGTVRGVGNHVVCSCGMSLLYTEEGFFEPPKPVANTAEWETSQRRALGAMIDGGASPLFSDGGITLHEIGGGHRETLLGSGLLVQHRDALELSGHFFPLDRIDSMAMVKANILLFSVGDHYYELRASTAVCLRKYLLTWQILHP